MREKEKNMAKKNYYAVKQGKVPGIYRTWDACKAQVHGYPGAIYKGFERLEEAEAFLGGGKMPEPLLRETKERIPLPRNERQYRARQHPILLLWTGNT